MEMPIEAVIDPLNADLLVAFEVIEHLFDPAAFVRQAWRHVKPGGLLVLSCPNGLGFEVQTLGAASLTLDTEHVNLFNPISLSMLLTDSGFEVEECTTPGRLDAEFVRDAVREKAVPLENEMLRHALLEQWDDLGWPLQELIAERGWSTHMWIVARRAGG
jgi:SAM-dependent methyltransferase